MNPAGTGSLFSDGGRGTGAFRWRPGWREAALFLALAVLGLLVSFAGAPGVTAELFCVNPGLWNPDLPLTSLTQILLDVAALASGFVSPRGFYLWGVALAAHSPFTRGLSAHALERDGVEFVGGTRGLVEFALITAMLIAFATFFRHVLLHGPVGRWRGPPSSGARRCTPVGRDRGPAVI